MKFDMDTKYHVFGCYKYEGPELLGSYVHPNDALLKWHGYDAYDAYVIDDNGDLVLYCSRGKQHCPPGGDITQWHLVKKLREQYE